MAGGQPVVFEKGSKTMILVGGASGALGSIVCQRLLAQNERVRAMSRAPETRLADLNARGAETVRVVALGLQSDIQGDPFDSKPLRERYPVQPTRLEAYARSRLTGGAGQLP